jgi:Skp family chaperone for outer membrane proteins
MNIYLRALTIVAAIAAIAGAGAFLSTKRATGAAEAQSSVVIAFVDSEEILEAFPQAVRINMELSELRKKSEEDLRQRITAKFGTGDIAALPGSSQMEVQQMVEKADEDYQKEMERLRQQKWTPVVDAVNSVIQQVGVEFKAQVVLEREVVLHGGIDLTDEVIKRLPK